MGAGVRSVPDLFAMDVQPLFERHRADWLKRARAVARMIGQGGRLVTVDDVRRLCPPPDRLDPRVMGAIFRTSEWERVDHCLSSRRTCHHRPIAVFRLAASVSQQGPLEARWVA